MTTRLVKDNTRRNYPVRLIGGKSQGLIKLKRLEQILSDSYEFAFDRGVIIPPFFIIPANNYLADTGSILKHADALETSQFAVRSSSPYEDGITHSFDGVFDSYLPVERSGLIEAIKAVRASALGSKAKQYSKDFNVRIDDRMAVIVQRMVDGYHKGIIYSKFPASIEVSKILSWGNDKSNTEITLIRRELEDTGIPYTLGHKVLEGQGLERIESKRLCDISYYIEGIFGYPVRVEYQTGWIKKGYYNIGECLYLLQARSIAGIDNPTEISMPELEEGELLIGTKVINGTGDYTLPAVVIYDKEGKKNLPYKTVENLDKKYPDGYILICKFLIFSDQNYDVITPNKKAVLDGTRSGRHHGLDIARAKGILYLGTESFAWDVAKGEILIKTGDILRVVSDGIKGYLYRPN